MPSPGQYADFGKLGYLASRHHEAIPENSERDVMFRARVESHAKFEGGEVEPPKLTWIGDEVNHVYAPPTSGLLQGDGFASIDRPRREEIGAWGCGVLPLVWTAELGGLIMASRTHADPTLAPWGDATSIGQVPQDTAGLLQIVDGLFPRGGEAGIVVAGSDPRDQQAMLFPLREHVAAHRGNGHVYSTPIYDMTGDSIDYRIAGGLHSHLRVSHDGVEYVPAWFLAGADDDTGFGAVYGPVDGGPGAQKPQTGQSVVAGPAANRAGGFGVAFAGEAKDGPFHLGHAEDKHQLTINADGEPVNPLHIRIGALFYKDKVQDGPLKLSDWKRGAQFPQETKVEFGWNFDDEVWDWYSYSPLFEPRVPLPRDRVPVEDIPGIPVDPPNDRVPPADQPPVDRVPRTGRPMHTPLQLSAPSFCVTGEANEQYMPYDGRDGWSSQEVREGRGWSSETGTDDRAELRGGPTPHVGHIAGVPKMTVDGSQGLWAYLEGYEPGEVSDFGTAEAGVILFAPWPYNPGQAAVDGVDFSAACGTLTVGLRSYCASSSTGPQTYTRLAWGVEDYTTGGMVDGPYLTNNESRELVFGRVTAAGGGDAGVLVPTATQKGQLGTSTTEWAELHVADAYVSNKLTVGGLIDPTGLELTPQSEAPSTNCLWVRTGSPTTLMFTDSAGADFTVNVTEV